MQQMGRDKLYVEADYVRSLAANFDLRFRAALYERLRELLGRERRKLLLIAPIEEPQVEIAELYAPTSCRADAVAHE